LPSSPIDAWNESAKAKLGQFGAKEFDIGQQRVPDSPAGVGAATHPGRRPPAAAALAVRAARYRSRGRYDDPIDSRIMPEKAVPAPRPPSFTWLS